MNRDAAIEAGAKALNPRVWTSEMWTPFAREQAQREARRVAAAVIDAAAPHLMGDPIQWIVVNHYGDPAYSGIKDQAEALDRARRWNEDRPADSRYRVVALVPVDQP